MPSPQGRSSLMNELAAPKFCTYQDAKPFSLPRGASNPICKQDGAAQERSRRHWRSMSHSWPCCLDWHNVHLCARKPVNPRHSWGTDQTAPSCVVLSLGPSMLPAARRLPPRAARACWRRRPDVTPLRWLSALAAQARHCTLHRRRSSAVTRYIVSKSMSQILGCAQRGRARYGRAGVSLAAGRGLKNGLPNHVL